MDAIDRVISQWDKEIPQLDTDSMALMGRFMRIYKYLETQVSALHKSYGLTQGEFDVLATLRRSGGDYQLTPSKLMDSMMLTSGAMTNRIDKLETKNLITRTHSEQDRRSVEVKLTEQGLSLIDELIHVHVETQNQLTQGLAPEQLRELNQLMKQWLNQFE
ncbi:MarR family transcriptional regulator [Vibrio sp. AK197]|uniref:MarR family winged helix-turn-helix transcriptional regulator n=1 Tax=Vibrio olivae TaxID=1243002 RepID=A0ABV5HR47_9VIBR